MNETNNASIAVHPCFDIHLRGTFIDSPGVAQRKTRKLATRRGFPRLIFYFYRLCKIVKWSIVPYHVPWYNKGFNLYVYIRGSEGFILETTS